MDLTPGQQRLVFVVVVLALAGLGIYLIGAHESGGTPAAAPSTSSAASSPPASGVPPTMLPSTAAPVPTAGGAEIYQWLPFTPADLTAAANTTTAFAKAYATWSYTESAAAYAATFQSLATPTQVTVLKEGYSTAGVAQQRTADKQVSTGSGTIDSITAFSSDSITFDITVTDTVTSTQPAVTPSSQYGVTVVSSASGWQVNDIQLAQLGNQGN